MDFVGLLLVLAGAWLLWGATTNKKTVDIAKSAVTNPSEVRSTISSDTGYSLPTNSEVFPAAYALQSLAEVVAATATANAAATTTRAATDALAGADGSSSGGSAGSSSGENSAGAAAVAFARTQIGKPYVWGATGPDSYDCSGLATAAYKAAGKDLGRITTASALISSDYTTVSQANLQLGDLVYPYAGHMGLYAGNGTMIEARGTVRQTTITTFMTARRPK